MRLLNKLHMLFHFKTQIEMAKVLEEDPTAYDYDKVYDKMTESKASLVAAKKATAEKKVAQNYYYLN